MTMPSLPRGIHPIPLPTPLAIGTVNVYLLREDSLTLVDTGVNTPAALQALEQGLRELGLCVEDLDQIVLTHHHCDHSGLLGALVSRSHAKVYCHPLTQQLIKRDIAFQFRMHAFYEMIFRGMDIPLNVREKQKQLLEVDAQFFGEWPGTVNSELQVGKKIPGCESWEVLYTPGHSQDHISLLRQEDGILLLGDHLIKHIASAILIEPPLTAGELRPNMMRMHRESLMKIRELEWQIGLPGHGKAITNPIELIDKRLAAQAKRSATILEQVRQGNQTCYTIAKGLMPQNATAMHMILPDLLGHLDCLVETRELQVDETPLGVWQYRVQT